MTARDSLVTPWDFQVPRSQQPSPRHSRQRSDSAGSWPPSGHVAGAYSYQEPLSPQYASFTFSSGHEEDEVDKYTYTQAYINNLTTPGATKGGVLSAIPRTMSSLISGSSAKSSPSSTGGPATPSSYFASTDKIEKIEKPPSGGKKLLSSIKNWCSTGEPSAQALKQHKKDTFKKAGVKTKDRLANARLHISVGTIPEDAIKPSGKGPEPEEIARQKAERLRAMQEAAARFGPSSPRSPRSEHSFSWHSQSGRSEGSASLVSINKDSSISCYQPSHGRREEWEKE